MAKPAAKRPPPKAPPPKARAAKRPAPQPKRRRRPPRARVLAGGIAGLALALAVMAAGPYSDYLAAAGRVDELTGRQQALTSAVTDLESERARLEDPAELEEQARSELGMTRPGEIPYIVVNPPTPTPEAPPPPAEEGQGGWWDRVVDTVTGWLP